MSWFKIRGGGTNFEVEYEVMETNECNLLESEVLLDASHY